MFSVYPSLFRSCAGFFMGAGVSAAGEILAEKGHFEQGRCFAASSGIQRPGGLDRRTQL